LEPGARFGVARAQLLAEADRRRHACDTGAVMTKSPRKPPSGPKPARNRRRSAPAGAKPSVATPERLARAAVAAAPARDLGSHVLGRTGGFGDRRPPIDIIDPAAIAALLADLSMPPPLALAPMRLEYRVVETRAPVRVAGAIGALFANDSGATVKRLRAAVGGGRRAARWTLAPSQLVLKDRREIWFRWFPDDSFALRGVAPATAAEQDALARFAAASGGGAWTAIEQPAVMSAWQALSREMAPERALFLLRNPGGGDPDFLKSQGKIAMAPNAVALFAYKAGSGLTALGHGDKIDAGLRYVMSAMQPGGWLTDFDAALKAGMGMRLVDPAKVTAALAADWIIAVGLSAEDGAAAFQTLLTDRIASGDFAFLPQDTPTNNAPGQPTPYKPPRADLGAFLREAVAIENGALASPYLQSAELFAEAFGAPVDVVARTPGAADLAYEDARAMLRVVGPALIDTAVENTAAIANIDEDEVIDFFADAMMARGPLPAVRFGKNPFGVLPVTQAAGLAPLKSDGANAQRIESFIRDFSSLIVEQSQRAADALTPVLQPGDPAASEKLETILKSYPVSRRIEVATVGQANAHALGCAYVNSRQHRAGDYLAELQSRPLGSLVDPPASDATYPLLYRLARLSLVKSTVFLAIAKDPSFAGLKLSTRVQPVGREIEAFNAATAKVGQLSLRALAVTRPRGFVDAVAGPLQRKSALVLAGLARLQEIAAEPDGQARLETLLMETVDLFQHRMDAWATGLAYRRLVKRRRAGLKGLAGGYWGMIGKLRPTSATGAGDGYIQAPSMHQATSAALLRSAYLRHGDAFALGLDSASVRQGMDLLDLLQAGIGPAAALGYLGERLLHERKQDRLIAILRNGFPLRDPRDDSGLEIRLFDGLRFLKANPAALGPPPDAHAYRQLQATLAQHFDSLADIVTAEAVHLRALGQADAANAWLQVLSGDAIPGPPTFLRTQRTGQGSTHRVAVLLAPKRPSAGDAPRAIAEPSLAALLADRLANFANAAARVTIAGVDGAADVTRDYALAADLGLAPIDLMIGGEGEIVARARHRLLVQWRDDPAVRALLGPLPSSDLVSYLNSERKVTVDLNVGATTPAALLAVAADLRRVAMQGRRLEPGDLAAAADPAQPLIDLAERDVLFAAALDLGARAQALRQRIDADVATLTGAVGSLIAAARERNRQRDAGADAAQLALLFAGLEQLHTTLDAALVPASRYGEPGALAIATTAEIADDPDGHEIRLAALTQSLQAKSATLLAAAPPASAPATATEVRALIKGLADALGAALDGDAIRILPILPRKPETTPLLAAPAGVAAALGEWRDARVQIRRTIGAFGSGWKAYPTTDAATGADDPDADARADEGLAPRTRLHGYFVSRSDPATAAEFAGFVTDEWAERRPSRMQQTGLAINYDSPQSEAPQCLLLCEPSGPGMGAWSNESAAGMVVETIRLMKTRALTAQRRPMNAPLLPGANQIPFLTPTGAPTTARIPVRQYKFVGELALLAPDSSFLRATNVEVGISGAGFNEIGGFSKVRE